MAKIHKARKLPVQQLTVLALCRFAEPIAFSSVYVYEVPLPSQMSIHLLEPYKDFLTFLR